MSRSVRAGAGMSEEDIAGSVAFTEQSQEDIDAGRVEPMELDTVEVVESSVSPPPVGCAATTSATQPQPSTSSVSPQAPRPPAPRFRRGIVPVGGIVSTFSLCNRLLSFFL